LCYGTNLPDGRQPAVTCDYRDKFVENTHLVAKALEHRDWLVGNRFTIATLSYPIISF